MTDARSTCRFVVATPVGRGAIATIIAFGDPTLSLIDRYFRPAHGSTMTIRFAEQVRYGTWTATEACPGEDLIICTTGRGCLEIHCHGGEAAVNAIAQSLCAAGAQQISVLEYLQSWAGSDIEAELMELLIQAATYKVAEHILRQIQLQPAFWKTIQASDLEIPLNIRQRMIEDAVAWSEFGIHLTTPWEVVFCGVPNVGKSSLVNAILGFQRSIVHAQAGTTRDSVVTATAIDGWPVHLVDTAGIQRSDDSLEQIGIESSRQSIHSADRVVLVVESSTELSRIRQQIQELQPDLVIGNKVDLGRTDCALIDRWVSAVNGDGIPELLCKLSELIVPVLPEPCQAFPVSAQQIANLRSLLPIRS